jgi:hypothetical protein
MCSSNNEKDECYLSKKCSPVINGNDAADWYVIDMDVCDWYVIGMDVCDWYVIGMDVCDWYGCM